MKHFTLLITSIVITSIVIMGQTTHNVKTISSEDTTIKACFGMIKPDTSSKSKSCQKKSCCQKKSTPKTNQK